MSFRKRLRTLAVCVVLEWALLTGAPVRAEQISDLLRSLNAPKIAREDPESAPSTAPPEGG
jgi:hypothetical protein